MKKLTIMAALLAVTLTTSAQTLFQHPWQGKKVAYFGDSITDPRNSGSKTKWWQFLQQ